MVRDCHLSWDQVCKLRKWVNIILRKYEKPKIIKQYRYNFFMINYHCVVCRYLDTSTITSETAMKRQQKRLKQDYVKGKWLFSSFLARKRMQLMDMKRSPICKSKHCVCNGTWLSRPPWQVHRHFHFIHLFKLEVSIRWFIALVASIALCFTQRAFVTFNELTNYIDVLIIQTLVHVHYTAMNYFYKNFILLFSENLNHTCRSYSLISHNGVIPDNEMVEEWRR